MLFRLLGLMYLVIRPLSVLVMFTFIIFSGRKAPWCKFSEIVLYKTGCKPLLGEIKPLEKETCSSYRHLSWSYFKFNASIFLLFLYSKTPALILFAVHWHSVKFSVIFLFFSIQRNALNTYFFLDGDEFSLNCPSSFSQVRRAWIILSSC